MNEKTTNALLAALHEAMNDDPRGTLDAIVAALQGAVGDPEEAPPELVDLTVRATTALGDLFAALTGEGRGRDAPAPVVDPTPVGDPDRPNRFGTTLARALGGFKFMAAGTAFLAEYEYPGLVAVEFPNGDRMLATPDYHGEDEVQIDLSDADGEHVFHDLVPTTWVRSPEAFEANAAKWVAAITPTIKWHYHEFAGRPTLAERRALIDKARRLMPKLTLPDAPAASDLAQWCQAVDPNGSYTAEAIAADVSLADDEPLTAIEAWDCFKSLVEDAGPPEHTRDSDCTALKPHGFCLDPSCGADHRGEPCIDCGGVAFHNPGCPHRR